MAHSAYPELGESAIEKLLDVFHDLRRMPLPTDPILGPSTLNIGIIAGGRAPNVIPDFAKAEVMIRLIDEGAQLAAQIPALMKGRADCKEVLRIPALHLGKLDGFKTTVVAYTTDIPAFQGAWGQPFLIGPGAIHVAHTSEEHIPKSQILEAIEIYKAMATRLLV
jgi:acetylornithine deacetylase